MTNDPSIWTGYPEKISLDKGLSFPFPCYLERKREREYDLYLAAHDKTK